MKINVLSEKRLIYHVYYTLFVHNLSAFRLPPTLSFFYDLSKPDSKNIAQVFQRLLTLIENWNDINKNIFIIHVYYLFLT